MRVPGNGIVLAYFFYLVPEMKNYLTNPGLLKKTITILFFGACFVFFAFFYQHHLYFIEQLQLFRFSSDYFAAYFQKPSSVSCLLGDFLTQFYYLKTGGAVIITACLWLLYYLVNWFFSTVFSWKYAGYAALLFTAVVAILHFSLVYPLAATLSLIIALGVYRVYASVNRFKIRLISGILLIPILYALTGWGVYVFGLAAVCFEYSNNQIRSLLKGAYGFVLLMLVVISPVCMRSYYHLTTGQARLYPVSEFSKPVPNFLFETLFSLDYEWHAGRPERTIKLAQKAEANNRYITYYYNLASAATNRLPENLLSFYQNGILGMFIPFNEETNYINLIFGNEVYYFTGDINAAQYYALMANTFSPRCESARMICRLAETNIINGQYAAAEKYLNLLKQTLFYSKWARDREPYLYNEELNQKTPWISVKRAQMPTTDQIKANPNDFVSTLYHLLHDRPDNQAALTYLLNVCLLYKDINSFYDALTTFRYDQPKGYMPPIYQEALMVYYDIHKDLQLNASILISDDVVRKFLTFNERFRQYNGYKNALAREFGQTYWFYLNYAVLPN